MPRKVRQKHNTEVLKMMSNQAHQAILLARREALLRLFTGAGVSLISEHTLNALCQAYQQGPICLFTGAGVSFTKAKHYRTPGWWDLLMEIYGRIHPELEEEELQKSFKKLRSEYPLAWDIATVLYNEAGGKDKFLPLMRRVLVGRTGRDATYKRLPKAYLDHAATLNAIIAFCSRLRAIRVHPCLIPNSNVRAVLTLNYDWFLEGGATQKYNANPFKPMASLKSKEDPPRLPVYHIHGYIPHGIHRKPKYELILTVDSYCKAYEPDTFTRQSLDKFLGRFSTLFIGISFKDEHLLQRLEALAKQDKTPAHFALLKQGSSDKALLHHLEKSAGVRPILYCCHEQIPTILGHVYQSGLTDEDLKVLLESRTGSRIGYKQISRHDYWAMLFFNKP